MLSVHTDKIKLTFDKNHNKNCYKSFTCVFAVELKLTLDKYIDFNTFHSTAAGNSNCSGKSFHTLQLISL